MHLFLSYNPPSLISCSFAQTGSHDIFINIKTFHLFPVSFWYFIDIQGYLWYVKWATELGIVNGIGANKFAPETNIIRQYLVAILYRYADIMGITLPKLFAPAIFPLRSSYKWLLGINALTIVGLAVSSKRTLTLPILLNKQSIAY